MKRLFVFTAGLVVATSLQAFAGTGQIGSGSAGETADRIPLLKPYVQQGYTKLTNRCEASLENAQGAQGDLDLSLFELKNAQGDSLTVLSYDVNDAANEVDEVNTVMKMSLADSLKSIEGAGTQSVIDHYYDTHKVRKEKPYLVKGVIAQMFMSEESKAVASIQLVRSKAGKAIYSIGGVKTTCLTKIKDDTN
jgi:hypothetical protein